MSDVSVIGLGAMGSALARALVRSGRRVTVWNRTSAKADPLVRDGATLAPSAAMAVGASPILVVCVDNYDVTRAILGTREVAAALAGKVLVQLSTGTPREAREGESWARERGVAYLDGAILAFPDHIATPDASILVSGAESVFRQCEPIFKILAENTSYLGENVGAASAMDCATLSYFAGALLGALHGARICESEGLRVDEYGALMAAISSIVGGDIKHLGEAIQTATYQTPQATLGTWAAAVQRILQQAQDAKINSELPTFASRLFQKGVTAGFKNEEVAALIKVLRGGT